VTVKLSTTLNNLERSVSSEENKKIILRFFDFMKRIGTSERYQNNNLKAIITYSKFLGPSISLNQVKKKDQITSFLDSKINGIEEDPDFVDPFLSSNEITYSHYLLFLQIEKRAGINNNITDLLRTCITFLTAYPF
jgi:hypothetical protein